MQSSDRGLGAIVKSTSPIHVNISVAMIRTLNDAMRVVEELGIDRRVEVGFIFAPVCIKFVL